MHAHRCINLDWLEVHALEPPEPRNANYFRSLGWHVVEREYGTRVYKEMFTIYEPNGEPLLEIRRAPVSGQSAKGMCFFEPYSCHIRLHNRTCYFKQPNPFDPSDNFTAANFLDQFLVQYGFEFRRISRVDICLDFEKFDSGDDPQKFLVRYLNGKYSKINQGNITAHGKDLWDGRFWNSISWGSLVSQVGTKMYNKSMEIKECRDKPYIRQAWASAGLVDDMNTLLAHKSDGTTYKPDIWRVEFSIRSSVRRWFVMEHDTLGNKHKRSVRNTLDNYNTDSQLLALFASLVDHYFHFKYFEPGQRKDRCKDKPLFKFGLQDAFYKVDKVATSKPTDSTLLALKNRLTAFLSTIYDETTKQAGQSIIQTIDRMLKNNDRTQPYRDNEAVLLQRLLAYRMADSSRPFSEDLAFIQELLSISDKIF